MALRPAARIEDPESRARLRPAEPDRDGDEAIAWFARALRWERRLEELRSSDGREGDEVYPVNTGQTT